MLFRTSNRLLYGNPFRLNSWSSRRGSFRSYLCCFSSGAVSEEDIDVAVVTTDWGEEDVEGCCSGAVDIVASMM